MTRMGQGLIAVAVLAAAGGWTGAGLAMGADDGIAMATGAPAIDAGEFKISGEVRYGAAGAPVVLFHYFNLGPDCGPTEVALTITDPPEHGQVRFVDGAEAPVWGGRPLFAAPDPRARCADELVTTRDAVYDPAAGFTGHDRLTVEFREGGEVFDDTIEINVEKLAPDKPAPVKIRHRS